MKKLLLTFTGFALLLPLFAADALGLSLNDFRQQVFKPENLPGDRQGEAPVQTKINEVAHYVTDIILFISGTVAIILLIVAGIQYIIAFGQQEQMDKAKNSIQRALKGFLIIIFAYAIITNLINLIFRAVT